MNAQDVHLPPVYAATYNHLGIILWGQAKLAQVLDQEIDWLERHPGFRLGWDHEAYTYDHLAEHAPEVLDKMRAALARFRGRLGVGSCTYGQPLSMFIDGESNVRQLTMAMETTEQQLGYPLSVYIMSEHPFHAQLPQLLAGCGFRGAILRTHFMMYGFNPEYEAPVGWWVGVDGSRIPALPTYPGQLVSPLFQWKIPGLTSTLDNRILTDAISENCQMTLADFRRQFGQRIQPLVATRADDVRNRESLIEVHEGDPGYEWVLVEEVFDLLPQPRAEFRTAANDFKVRMPWGYCGNWMWNRCREAEVKVLTAERLAAIGCALGGPAYEEELAAAWKNLLVAQHHDIQICGLEDDARHYLSASLSRSEAVIERAMAAVAPRIGPHDQGQRHVVFNPLAWERSAWVPTTDGEIHDGGRVVTVPALGFQALDAREKAIDNLEPTLDWQPRCEYDGLRYPEYQETASGRELAWPHEPVGRLRTPFYEIYVAPSGGFRLLLDRASGQKLIAPPKTSGTLAGVIGGQDCVSVAGAVDAHVERDRACLIEEGQIGGIPYRSEWTFYWHTRRIDWHAELTFDRELIGRPKSARASCPPSPQVGGTGERVRSERRIAPMEGESRPWYETHDQMAVVPAYNDHEYKIRLRFYPCLGPYVTGVRDLPFHIAETDDPYVQGIYWTAVADGTVGLALLNRGLMGSVREQDGAFSAVLAFSLPYVWGTRVLSGTYTYDLGILPFTGHWRQADLHRQALEYNFPCVVCSTPVTEDSLRVTDSLGTAWSPYGEAGDGQAILSALYIRGGKTYARFYECRGEGASVALEWMGRPVQWTATDLRERALGQLGRHTRLAPWQVQTLMLDPG